MVGPVSKEMKILLIGGTGQLGQTYLDLIKNHKVFCPSREELNLESQFGIGSVVKSFSPDVIINAAAWTNVVGAEGQRERVLKINSESIEIIAIEARNCGAKVIHLSTDFVFDGYSTTPYDEASPKNPLSVYGESKSQGEDKILGLYPEKSYIIRTSWLYSKFRNNFVKAILAKLMQNKDPILVVQDEFGSPTWTGDLVRAIDFLSWNNLEPGIFHYANSGGCSRSEFASRIAQLAGFPSERIVGIETMVETVEVRRPSYSVLDSTKFSETSSQSVPHWEESLAKSIQEIIKQVEREVKNEI
jgi:dTDP-4-dehydrorhamnose reductase